MTSKTANSRDSLTGRVGAGKNRIHDPIRSVRGDAVAKNAGVAEAKAPGTELFEGDKVFEDIQAEPGQKAFTFMHTVPYEGSVGLVNLLTTTRVLRKGFDTSLILYGPGILMASGTRGLQKVGAEAFPGQLAVQHKIR